MNEHTVPKRLLKIMVTIWRGAVYLIPRTAVTFAASAIVIWSYTSWPFAFLIASLVVCLFVVCYMLGEQEEGAP